MLERVLIVRHVVVVVVGICQEGVARSENVRRGEVGRRQLRIVRILDNKHFLRLAVKILAEFVAQVGVGIAVADYLYGLRSPDTSVVCSDDNGTVGLCESLKQLANYRMPEPLEGYAAISRLVVGKLTHHL